MKAALICVILILLGCSDHHQHEEAIRSLIANPDSVGILINKQQKYEYLGSKITGKNLIEFLNSDLELYNGNYSISSQKTLFGSKYYTEFTSETGLQYSEIKVLYQKDRLEEVNFIFEFKESEWVLVSVVPNNHLNCF